MLTLELNELNFYRVKKVMFEENEPRKLKRLLEDYNNLLFIYLSICTLLNVDNSS